MTDARFHRNELFFGVDGQRRLRSATIAIVGAGGNGSHIIQQLALLGVGEMRLVDHDRVDVTSLNRNVAARCEDATRATPKVDAGARLIHAIDPTIRVQSVTEPLTSDRAFALIRTSSCVFGCVDNEGARLVLTELCAAYGLPYFDVSTEIDPSDSPPTFGGQICVAWRGNGCLSCLGVLDHDAARADLASPEAARDRDVAYGLPRAPAVPGPSVVSINGTVSSIAVTEFMLARTGVREPRSVLTYHGLSGKVTVATDAPLPDCYYCKFVRGQGAAANVERYVRFHRAA